MNKTPIRFALHTALVLATPLLLGAMHCARRCPPIGPEYASGFAVEQRRLHENYLSGLQRDPGRLQLPVTILRQELRVTQVRGEIVATSCTPEVEPWSRAIEPGVILPVPAAIDCLTFSSEQPILMNIHGSLHIFTQEVRSGGRGVGVHGQHCFGSDLEEFIHWEAFTSPAH